MTRIAAQKIQNRDFSLALPRWPKLNLPTTFSQTRRGFSDGWMSPRPISPYWLIDAGERDEAIEWRVQRIRPCTPPVQDRIRLHGRV